MGEKLGYRPALDGVRAVSIALVIAFHLGAPWLPGGYLGVSVFFTLSGFLITSLLLNERQTTGRIDIRAFYVRRLRRLLPASLLCLAGIAVLASAGAIAARADLRVGVLAAVFQVANWEHLLGHHSYADLFLAPSPIDHFWSLAIEEQFYWLWPLAIAGITAAAARRGAKHGRVSASIATVLIGAFVTLSASAFATAHWLGGDAAYFASWARFAEILAGAALAAVVANRALPARVALLAPACLAAIIVLSVVTPAGRGWAYGGGLPLFALVSVGLIAGVLVDGPVARLLAREPIPWIGRISYGLYLFHWPVFTLLPSASVLEKLALTLAITTVSYRFVERPIRSGRWLRGSVTYLQGAAIAYVTVAACVAALVPAVQVARRGSAPVVISARLANAATPRTPAPATPTGPARPTPGAHVAAAPAVASPPRPRVVALFGDSIADWLVRDAAPTFTRTDITLVDAAIEGCDGAVGIPPARGRLGQILPLPSDCKEWPVSYRAAVENPKLPVDVAVLVVGQAPILDREVAGRWVGPCTDMSWYSADIAARVAYLSPRVGDVVLAMPSWGGKLASYLAGADHVQRMSCIRTQLQGVASRLGLDVVDLADELCPAGPSTGCADSLRHNDGVHVDHEAAPAVLDWLLGRLPPRH